MKLLLNSYEETNAKKKNYDTMYDKLCIKICLIKIEIIFKMQLGTLGV